MCGRTGRASYEPPGSRGHRVREPVILSSRDRVVPRAAAGGTLAPIQQRSPVINQATAGTQKGGPIGTNCPHNTRLDAMGSCMLHSSEPTGIRLFRGCTNSLAHHGGASGSGTSRIERRHSVGACEERWGGKLGGSCCYQLRSPATSTDSVGGSWR